MQSEPKVALVTGGAGGIGFDAAMEFVKAGCRVVVADIDYRGGGNTMETARVMADRLGRPQGTPDNPVSTFVKTDVSSEPDVVHLLEHIKSTYGRLDYAMLNAGIEGERAAVENYPTDVFDKVMAVNVRGVFLCLKHLIPLMRETAAICRQGAIVITSSNAGLHGMPEFSAYSASKHALVGLMRSAAAECAPHGLRVNCINPATTDTPMVDRFAARWPEWQEETNKSYPLGRIATATEVAEAAVWMCTKAGFMTGQTLVLDGGSSCS